MRKKKLNLVLMTHTDERKGKPHSPTFIKKLP